MRLDLSDVGPICGVSDHEVRGEIGAVMQFTWVDIIIDEAQARTIKHELEMWLNRNTLKPTNPDDIPF